MAYDLNKIPTKAEDVRKSIHEWAEQGRNRQEMTFWLAFACLTHANQHGDLTLLSEMHSNFPKREAFDQAGFRYWVAVFSTPGQKLVDKGEDGLQPTSALKFSMIDFDRERGQFVKRTKIDGKNAPKLVDSFTDSLELAKLHPWWELGAYRRAQQAGEKVFKPAQDVQSVARFIGKHLAMAEKAGDGATTKLYRSLLDALKPAAEVKISGESVAVELHEGFFGKSEKSEGGRATAH